MIICGADRFCRKTVSIFFENPVFATRSFFEIVRNVMDLFLELSACDPKFSGKERVAVRICLALTTDPEDGGGRPYIPANEQCCRPRQEAPAADRLPDSEETGKLPGEGPIRRPGDFERNQGGGRNSN